MCGKRWRWVWVNPSIPFHIPAGPPSLGGSSGDHSLFATLSCCPSRAPTRTTSLNPAACVDSLSFTQEIAAPSKELIRA